MNPLSPIALTGTGYEIAISPDAEAIKKSLIFQASAIVAVQSQKDSEIASAAVKGLAKFRFDLEKSRKAVKEPVLDLGKKIDAAAKEFGDAVETEEKRIAGLVAAYAAEQERQRRAEEERLRREAEEARRREAEEIRKRELAECQARDAEERRIAAEKAAAEATGAKQKAEAEAERLKAEQEAEAARKAQEDAERAEWEALYKAQEAQEAKPAVAVPQAAKSALDFEVVDIRELYREQPGLVTLTPARAFILAELKRQQQAGEPIGLPGIRVIETFKVATR